VEQTVDVKYRAKLCVFADHPKPQDIQLPILQTLQRRCIHIYIYIYF